MIGILKLVKLFINLDEYTTKNEIIIMLVGNKLDL
jgi:hypothetical protein